MDDPATDTRDARVERLQRLLDIGRSLTAELDLPTVLDRILATARELTGARFAAIGVLDENRRQLAEFLTSGTDPHVRAMIGDLPRGRGILGLLIDRPEPIRLHDVSEHPRSYGFPPGHPPMRGFLGVPIRIRGEAWGNLYLTEKEDDVDFDDDDLQAVIVLSEWAAIAIQNARLFGATEERRTELERAVHAMEATMDIALALGGETDLDRILELIVKRARALVEADSLLLWLVESDGLRLHAHAGHATPPADLRLPMASTAGRALETQRPLRVEDVRTGLTIDPSTYGMHEAHTALLVPLVFRGRGLGVLVAFDRVGTSPSFSADDERALRSFASSAATAVASAKTVEEQRLRDSLAAAEAERRRWARELHDETLQGLGALKLALRSTLQADPGRAEGVVRAAIEQLDQEIASLRAIITDLRPASLDDLGLEPALRSLGERIAARSSVTVDNRFGLGEARIPAELETVAYRVVQEALNNVVKHAEAERATVSTALEDRCVVVVVQDDGCGFAAAGNGSSSGFGLAGMRERAALAGGRVDVRSSDRGTTVSLVLPLP